MGTCIGKVPKSHLLYVTAGAGYLDKYPLTKVSMRILPFCWNYTPQPQEKECKEEN